MAWFENLDKISFFGENQKCPKNSLSWFFHSFLNFCKINKNCDYSANFQKISKKFFLHGASWCGFHICFCYHSNPTWNTWDMAKICSAGFFSSPLNRQLRPHPWIGLIQKREKMMNWAVQKKICMEMVYR